MDPVPDLWCRGDLRGDLIPSHAARIPPNPPVELDSGLRHGGHFPGAVVYTIHRCCGHFSRNFLLAARRCAAVEHAGVDYAGFRIEPLEGETLDSSLFTAHCAVVVDPHQLHTTAGLPRGNGIERDPSGAVHRSDGQGQR